MAAATRSSVGERSSLPAAGVDACRLAFAGHSLLFVTMTTCDTAPVHRKPRDLLPLPLPRSEPDPRRDLSRAVQRRVERRLHWQRWATEGIQALNGMGHEGGPTPAAPPIASATQQLALNHIEEAYRRMSKVDREDDAGTGALSALCAQARVYGEDRANVTPYRPERVSWPPVGTTPVEISRLLRPEDMTWYGDWQSHMLRPGD